MTQANFPSRRPSKATAPRRNQPLDREKGTAPASHPPLEQTAFTAPQDGGSGSREWWAQRWIDVLEGFGWRRRLERARNYVREGKVLSFQFQGSRVIAQVQGTAPEPYEVLLSLESFSDEQWSYVIDSMAQRAIFTAKLLAGEMPPNIEDSFTANGLSLFPFSKFDIESKCSCPDPVNPCKHIGAVYYLLGDHFSQDPFILFQLRGRTQQQIIASLRQKWSAACPEPLEPVSKPAIAPTATLKIDNQFWQYNEQLDPSLVVIAPPPSSQTVLDVLGPIPLEPDPMSGSRSTAASTQAGMEVLEKIYEKVAQQALLLAMMPREQL
ncbi:MAG TPA: hypothetical protein V6D03_16320 [Candidatus Caenarcaniphilales bacterium]